MRHRVLLIVESANPEWVSVPLVGWHIANALRGVADVHIVTQIRNKAAFERQGLVEGLDFTAIDSERLARPLNKIGNAVRGGAGKGWTTMTAIRSLGYFYFERLVWAQFGARILAGEFDVVHRVTPLSPTAPSSLSRKCAKAGVPFVLGPLNGGLPWPASFNAERHKEREWLSYVRSIYKFLPAVRSTYKHASAVIAASTHTKAELAARHPGKVIFIPENGIDVAKFAPTVRERDQLLPLKLCYVGRLVPYKCPDLVITGASKLLKAGLATLDIVGDGPMVSEIKALVGKLGLEASVTFHGWVDQAEVARIAAQCELFLFPSVREFGGGAVLEAMALGLVPIVLDYGGPGEIVTPETGFKVAMRDRVTIVRDIEVLLDQLAEGEISFKDMAGRGLERVDALYTWEKKAHQIVAVYDWARGNGGGKPEFGF